MTKNEIIEYLMTTPKNTNKNVLNSILAGVSNKDAIIEYALTSPYNMNINVLKSLIGEDEGGGTAAVVGNAVVGTAVAG